MNNIFEFATPQKIIFGNGSIQQIGKITARFGRRALLFCGAPASVLDPITILLDEEKIQTTLIKVSAEPTEDSINHAVETAKTHRIDFVISLGGGSALDSGKASAILVNNPGDLMDYLEVVGKGLPLQKAGLPFIAIPTTAGTGSEVTKNSVIGLTRQGIKVSLRSEAMLARVALIDPELTISLPPSITATTGLDALTQVIEPYVCNSPNPITDSFCREGMQRAGRSLRAAYQNGNELQARYDLCMTSLMGGLALANSRLGAVHGFAGPIGGMFQAAHGAVCARILPYAMQANIQALTSRSPNHPVIQRYREIARLLIGSEEADELDGVKWVKDLCKELNVLPLSAYGIRPDDISAIVDKASLASSMKGNPIPLTPEEMREIIIQAIES